MDIAALKAFLAVAENESFSVAADSLFLTQPAISKRIATLESELDTRLFDRIGRRTTLTEAGEALRPRAQNILLELEDSIREISNLSGQVQGQLRFGTSHHIGLHRLPPVLRKFTRSHPQVRMDIRFMDSEQACHAVEQGSLELGIVTLPPKPSPNLTTQLIWKDPLCVVTSNDHPLANKRNIKVEELAKYPAVLPARNTYTRQIAEQVFVSMGLELDISLSTNYLETIKMLVSVGIGWSILPVHILDKQVTRIGVNKLSLQRELGVVHHKGRTLSNAALALLKDLHKKATRNR